MDGMPIYFEIATENILIIHTITQEVHHTYNRKNRSFGPEVMTAKTGPIHLSSLVEIVFVD